jgi:DNA-binding NtrC family response regulator
MKLIQVLVIDSEEGTRELLRTSLKTREKIDLHLASSYEGALEVLSHQKEWALVLLNVWLPGKDGFAFVQDLRRMHPLTEFIVLSPEGSKVEIIKALRLGVVDYFEKPYAISEVNQAVDVSIANYLSKQPTPLRPEGGVRAENVPVASLAPKPRHLSIVGSSSSAESLGIDGGSPSQSAQVVGSDLSYTDLKRKAVESFEVSYLTQLLSMNHGNVSAAAREARLDRSNFLRLLRKYGLKSESFRRMAA